MSWGDSDGTSMTAVSLHHFPRHHIVSNGIYRAGTDQDTQWVSFVIRCALDICDRPFLIRVENNPHPSHKDLLTQIR